MNGTTHTPKPGHHLTPRRATSGSHTPAQRSRRRLTLALAAGTAALLALGACSSSANTPGGSTSGSTSSAPAPAAAAAKIDKLKIIVPADPGGGWDQTGRAIQQALQETGLVGSAQVINIGGAGGTVGLASLATEQDPNTLMVTGLVMVGAVELNASTNRMEDTAHVARLTEEALVVVVPPDSPYTTIDELIAAMVEQGQAISIAGGSAGGADHILAGQLLAAGGVPAAEVKDKLNYIPYSGGAESVTALLGGKVSAGISGVGEYAEQVAAGKMKALAVSGPERSSSLPDTPTMLESGLDVELTNWRGVIAPGSIDDQTKAALTELMVALHDTDAWTSTLETNNWDDAFLGGQEFSEFLTGDITAVGQTLADLGLVS